MTFDDFKAKHKERVLKGFDDIDGRDYWAEFKADLHTLLADERKSLELQNDELQKQLFAAKDRAAAAETVVARLGEELDATVEQRDLNFNNKRHAEKLFVEEREKKDAALRLNGELQKRLDSNESMRYQLAAEREEYCTIMKSAISWFRGLPKQQRPAWVTYSIITLNEGGEEICLNCMTERIGCRCVGGPMLEDAIECQPCGCPHPPPACRSGIEVLKDDLKRVVPVPKKRTNPHDHAYGICEPKDCPECGKDSE